MSEYRLGKIGKGKKWHILLDLSINARKDCQKGYVAAHSNFRYLEIVRCVSLPSDVLSTLPPESICKTCAQWFKYNRPGDYYQIFGKDE